MRNKFLILLFVSAAPFTAGCSSDDSSDIDPSVPFYQYLRAEFDITNQNTHIAANFNKKNSLGKDITLSGESSILFNGRQPNYANIYPYFYTYTFSGLENVRFKLTREKNKVYENELSLDDIKPIMLPAGFTVVEKNNSTVLTWGGDALASGESIQVTLTSDANGSNNFYLDQIGATSIDIKFTSTVTAGQAILSLSRVKILPLQQSDGSAGGVLQVVYTVSKTITIQ